MKTLSIGIAGAGPAGLAAALVLARDGHAVTVFDQFEAPRPLGSGLVLQPTGLAVLAELGLAERMLGLGSRLERMEGRVLPSGRIVLDVRYATLGHGRFGVGAHRSALFRVLHEAAAADRIPLAMGHAVRELARGADGRPALVLEGGRRTAPFDLVVDAMGLRSPLLPQFGAGPRTPLRYGALWASLPWPAAGFDPHALEQRYRRASTMIGVLPIGRRVEGGPAEAAFFWSLRLADAERWRAEGLEAWKDTVRALWPATAPLLDAIASTDQLTLARYGHAMLRRPYGERIVAIGDAFHAASPQLGQGANMALLDAVTLGEALRREGDLREALADYATDRLRQMRFYQALSRAFTPFYQSDSAVLPPLRDFVLAPATRMPLVRWFVTASVGGLVLAPRRLRGLPAGRGVRRKRIAE